MLPEDIVRCIFACVAQDRAICFPYYRDDIPPQVVLSHVCSVWRQIALDIGSLWSHITITISPQNNLRAFCELWLPRITGGSITVDASGISTHLASPLFREVLWDPLAHYQFKDVELVMNNFQVFGLIFMPNDISLQVERLGLAKKMCHHLKRKPLHLPQFIYRLLHSFRICGDFDGDDYDFFSLEYFALPWHQLRHVELGNIGIELSRFIRLLQLCTSLEVCSVEVWPGDTAEVLSTEPVTLFSLRKLTLVVTQWLHLLRETSYLLVLPSLRTLEIRGGEWTDNVHTVFRNQFNFHQLHELDITHIKCPPPIISILNDAPSLHHLCLPQHAVFDDESLRGLASRRLGRHLESLELFDSSCNVDDIVKLVETRREARNVISGPVLHIQVKSMEHKDEALRNSYWC
ncbi:hypothetical protein APHAL10511_006848 [Amanita phalloides]|nr:hypothetical protein APHAL10511_006848 [Amanita phalloides]